MSSLLLKHPPLICVVARVQFTKVTKIKTYIPDLQEAMRLDGYPHFQEQKTKSWQINDRADAGMNVAFEEISRWSFGSLEKTITIRVDRESISLLFTAYDHFENAKPHYRKILNMVEQVIPSLQPERVQLRYIAHIPLKDGEDPQLWVVPSVLGVPNLRNVPRLGSFSETSFQPPEGGQLAVRCMSLGTNQLTLPPDLLPLDAKLKHSLHSEGPFILLENVHERQAEPVVFSAQSCLDQLSALRGLNTEVFQATVTPKALESWK